MSMSAGLKADAGGRIVRRIKRVAIDDLMSLSALSPNGRCLAFVGVQTGKLVVVELEQEHATPIPIPDLRDVRLLAWSPDGQSLAVADISTLVVVSVSRPNVGRQFSHRRGAGFGRAGLFSRRGEKLIFQNANPESRDLLIELDLRAGTFETWMEVPGIDAAQAVFPKDGIAQRQLNGDYFVAQIDYWRGKLDSRVAVCEARRRPTSAGKISSPI